MTKTIVFIGLFLVLCGTAAAGEKEEVALRMQIVQEHIARLNEQLYYIPFEKRMYELTMGELQNKLAEIARAEEKKKVEEKKKAEEKKKEKGDSK